MTIHRAVRAGLSLLLMSGALATGGCGSEGPAGADGAPGNAGPAGAPGPKGDKGDVGSNVLWKWNGTSTSQFGSASPIGSPVNPTLSYHSPYSGLSLKLDAGSPADSGAIWWITDTVAFQSMCIHWALIGVAASDELKVGVVIAGDDSRETYLAFMHHVAPPSPGGTFILEISNGSSPSATAVSVPITPSTFSIVDLVFNGKLADTATYPPGGIPILGGTVDIAGASAAAHVRQAVYAQPLSGFAGSDWGTGVTNRIGLILQSGAAGVTDPAGLEFVVSGLTLSKNTIGTP